MGRKNRRMPQDGPELRDPAAYGARRIEEFGGEDWVVQQVTGSGSAKTYRCPGCDHEIRPATPHVVAFPAEDPKGVEMRRHWHTPCWAKRGHRGPRRQV